MNTNICLFNVDNNYYMTINKKTEKFTFQETDIMQYKINLWMKQNLQSTDYVHQLGEHKNSEVQNSRCQEMSSQNIQYLAARNNSTSAWAERLGRTQFSSAYSCPNQTAYMSSKYGEKSPLPLHKIESAITSAVTNTKDQKSFLIKKTL